MESKNLMIGDLVMAEVWTEEGTRHFPVRIDGIDENHTLIDGNCYVSWCALDKNKDDWEYSNALSPIPLTEDILKVNGWSYDDINNEWFHDKCPLILFSPWNEWGGYVLSCYNSIEFKYIHELQHALRLCGLTELADNFKIQED